MEISKEDEKYIEKKINEINSVLDRINKGLDNFDEYFEECFGNLDEIGEEIEKMKTEHNEFNLQMSYLKKRDTGRPFGMHFHDFEMTYQ